MNSRKFFLILLIITSIMASSCDNGDMLTYVEDTMLGPRFTSFSIDGVSGSIDTKAAKVQLNLTENSSLSALTPVFTIKGERVEHNGTVISSGNTTIDFTNAQVFTVFYKSGYSRDFTVTVAAPKSISITQESPTLSVNQTIQLTVMVTYTSNQTQNITSAVQWTSSNNSIASVTGGAVTGVAEGTSTITAQYGTLTDSVTVTVYAAPFLTITPANSTVISGETTSLAYSCTYTESGTTTDVTDLISLTSLDINIVQVVTVTSGTMEVIGWTTTGTGTIQASYSGVTADITIGVTARSDFYVAPAAGGLDTNPGSINYPLATISAAMIKAVSSNTIYVMAGTYTETVELKEGVSLYGSYPDTSFSEALRDITTTPSIINAPADSYALHGSGTIGTDTTIGYFNINGPSTTSTDNIAIYLENDASPTIMQCNIEAGTSASSYNSYAIIIDSSSPVIHRNFSIRGGTGDIGACAISITGTSSAVIRNNLIFAGFGNNSATCFYLIDCGSILIYNNTITGACSSGNTFRGIFLMGYSYPDIKNNIILNRTGDGTGTFYGVYENSNDADPTDFSYNIVYNIYTDTGDTCYADDLASALYVNYLELNSVTLYGGGNPTTDSNIVGNPDLDGNLSPQGVSPYVGLGLYLPVTGLADEDLYGIDRGTSLWDIGAVQLNI